MSDAMQAAQVETHTAPVLTLHPEDAQKKALSEAADLLAQMSEKADAPQAPDAKEALKKMTEGLSAEGWRRSTHFLSRSI